MRKEKQPAPAEGLYPCVCHASLKALYSSLRILTQNQAEKMAVLHAYLLFAPCRSSPTQVSPHGPCPAQPPPAPLDTRRDESHLVHLHRPQGWWGGLQAPHAPARNVPSDQLRDVSPAAEAPAAERLEMHAGQEAKPPKLPLSILSEVTPRRWSSALRWHLTVIARGFGDLILFLALPFIFCTALGKSFPFSLPALPHTSLFWVNGSRDDLWQWWCWLGLHFVST